MVRSTYLAALRKIKKDEEWQQKLKTSEEVSKKVEKKINDQKPWFPLRKVLKIIQNHLELNEPIIQLNSTIHNVASLLKKQLNEMKGIKHFETLKLTFKKTTVNVDKNEPKKIFKTKQLILIVKQKQ